VIFSIGHFPIGFLLSTGAAAETYD